MKKYMRIHREIFYIFHHVINQLIDNKLRLISIIGLLLTIFVSNASYAEKLNSNNSISNNWYQHYIDYLAVQYNTHPKWQSWLKQGDELITSATDITQSVIIQWFSQNNTSNANHLAVPTKATQQKLLNAIEQDRQLDPVTHDDTKQ